MTRMAGKLQPVHRILGSVVQLTDGTNGKHPGVCVPQMLPLEHAPVHNKLEGSVWAV